MEHERMGELRVIAREIYKELKEKKLTAWEAVYVASEVESRARRIVEEKRREVSENIPLR